MTRLTPRRRRPLAALLVLASSLFLLFVAGSASAATVTNGGFESGSLSGWSQKAEGSGEWSAISGTKAPFSNLDTEISKLEEELEEAGSLEEEEEIEEEIEEATEAREEGIGTVLPPFEGNFDAVADEISPSSMILYQDVALEPGQTHQLSMYLNYHSFAPIVAPNTLDIAAALVPSMESPEPNQQVRVDVMKASAAVNSMNPADILATVYATPTGGAEQIPWTHLSADLSPFAGQTVRIRVAAVGTDFYINAGVDAASITSVPIPPPSNVFTFGKKKKNAKNGTATLTVDVPGPGTLSLAGIGGKGAKASISAAKAKQPKKPSNAVRPVSATAAIAGAVNLTIKPTAAAKKYLKAKGSLSAKVAVTFTPTGGSPSALTTTVPLKLTKPKKK